MAGFNEREFELCYNAEFMRKNGSSIIGVPLMPSTRQEYNLGYDVEFRINNNGFTRSLFLQHKISHYAENRTGRNKRIWDCYNGPYYRFPIEKLDKTKQHNLLVDLAAKGEDVYYCAPIFSGRDRLETYAASNEIIDMSRYFDPLSMGEIKDFEQHHASCDPSGAYGFFYSEPKKMESVNTWEVLQKKAKHKTIDLNYFGGLEGLLSKSIHDAYDAIPTVPDDIKEKGIFVYVSYLLFRYYNLRWFIY